MPELSWNNTHFLPVLLYPVIYSIQTNKYHLLISPIVCCYRRGGSGDGVPYLAKCGRRAGGWLPKPVEGLYCKRPIQCLASSEILTPPPTSPAGECVPFPPAVRKTPDTALYSTYICKYFVQWCKYFVPKPSIMGASGVEYLYPDCGVVGGPGGGALYLVS